MPVYGDLKTMTLCDLLQWAAVNKKTGVLELERNKVCRRIEFRNGWICGCSSDDPPSRLGQFLLARGKITREALQAALAEQEHRRENLGMILLGMGAVNPAELSRQIAAKAEETIHGLFDWEDAIFRFHDGSTLDPNQIEVNISVDDILLKGIQHHDELTKIRKVFKSSGVVLARTDRPAPRNVVEREIARRIFESVDGKKTLAEILLHAHASEFLVIKLLFTLHKGGLLEIKEVRSVPPACSTLIDPPPPVERPREEDWESFTVDGPLDRDMPAAPPGQSTVPTSMGPLPAAGSELDTEVEVASRLLKRGEYEAALELLNASYRAHPDENYLRRQIAKTEAAYVEHVQRHGLTHDRVPVAASSDPAVMQGLGPQECYLMSLIDGVSDVRSILWVAPLREVDVLRTLRQMLDHGVIRLRDLSTKTPAADPAGVSADERGGEEG
jgi:hypothetical protein